MKKFLFFLSTVVLLSSCANEELIDEKRASSSTFRTASKNDNYELKKKFALALHKAFVNNPAIRQFIKNEALKKFDNDFDVLYNYIKGENIEGITFRQHILHYYENEQELAEIENAIPALTIFVPTLPEDSFSAEKWDISSEIPLVAIRLLDNDKTPVISSNSDSYLLDNYQIPGFPIVVIKECERVITPNLPEYSLNRNTEYLKNGFAFKFFDVVFNNITPLQPNSNPYQGNTNSLVNAWIVNGKTQNLAWQRDHVYYNINTNNPNGPFINNHQEQIISFRINGYDGNDALSKIAQSSGVNTNLSDPLLKPVVTQRHVSTSSFWTDGGFEFNVYLDHGAKTGTNLLTKGFSASPQSLFDITYEKIWSAPYIWVVKSLTVKDYNPQVELQTWRLEDYSYSWNFKIEEVDLTEEHTDTEQFAFKYNANFSIDPTDETLKKMGMKFGASLENQQTRTQVTKYTLQSNPLGYTDIHFGDNVIISETPVPMFNTTEYTYREYSLGHCFIKIRPVKVQ